MALLLGLDIGTTSTIGIVIDDAGRTLAVESRPVAFHSDHANWAEEDTEEWWRNVGEICRALVAKVGDAGAIAAIGVTGMLPAVILLDRAGRPLRRSIQQNDARATAELERYRAAMEETRFLELTGTGYSQQLVGPKLMWLRTHEPDVFAHTAHVVGASDYITYRLSGSLQVEHNWALESGFVRIATGAYDERLIAMAAGLDRSLLPPIRKSHEIVGGVTADAAHHTGLRAGTPVVAGCADHVASAFVCGASHNGDLVIKFGGAGDILLSSDAPISDRRLFIDYHIVPGLYFPNGCMAASGTFLNWIVRNWAGGELDKAHAAGLSIHQWLDRQATAVRAENDLLFLPYVLGEKTPLMDPHARGTLVGLGLHHDLRHMWLAALEGVVFGFRHHVDVFAERELAVSRVFAADGGAASDLWLQIAADALQRPVTRVDGHPGSCLGAAFVAGMGAGSLNDWSDIKGYVAAGKQFLPDPAASARLDQKYALWRDTYRRLQTMFPQLSGLLA